VENGKRRTRKWHRVSLEADEFLLSSWEAVVPEAQIHVIDVIPKRFRSAEEGTGYSSISTGLLQSKKEGIPTLYAR